MVKKSKTQKLYDKYGLWLDILALILIIAQFILVRNEFIVAALVIVFLIAAFSIHYERREWKLFIIGVILGVVLELGGDQIYKLQYWEQGSLFGIPLWLPLMWGYAFVFIRRIGNQIVSPIGKKK